MLTFLKLGGSLITDKTRPYTPRLDLLSDLAGQIAAAMNKNENLELIIGHGSGSYGHVPASKYGTRQGVSGSKAWQGFAKVWYQASKLNRLVVDALVRSDLPAVTLSPFASITAHRGKPFIWDLYPLRSALENGLLPVIHGDVVFDDECGGTILSTEDLFIHLARVLKPDRILLAGLEAGVWQDFPARTRLLAKITPQNFSGRVPGSGSAIGHDVTGGMQTKVTDMLALVEELGSIEICVFSGEQPDNLRRALLGASPGTCLSN